MKDKDKPSALSQLIQTSKHQFVIALERANTLASQRSKFDCHCDPRATIVFDPTDGTIYHRAFMLRVIPTKTVNGIEICTCIHPELQSVTYISQHSHSTQGFVLLSTYAPCVHCANAITFSAKFAAVVYGMPNTDSNGLAILEYMGVDTFHLELDCNAGNRN